MCTKTAAGCTRDTEVNRHHITDTYRSMGVESGGMGGGVHHREKIRKRVPDSRMKRPKYEVPFSNFSVFLGYLDHTADDSSPTQKWERHCTEVCGA